MHLHIASGNIQTMEQENVEEDQVSKLKQDQLMTNSSIKHFLFAETISTYVSFKMTAQEIKL